MEQFLLQLFIFLAAAAIAVPIAKKIGLGSVLGYLIAGIIIGPFGLTLINEVEEIMHFTEFGVVMMLFLVGLELKPSLLWQLKTPILGMGGVQVVVTTIVISAIGFIFIPWQQALALGLILSLSSTAIVLQTLKEKGLMNTPTGRSIFSVLLFQDLAVIPMLALMPLLSTIHVSHEGSESGVLFDIAVLPGYLQFLVTLLAIFAVFFVGKYLSRPMFRIIAATNIREIFVAAALVLVVGISLLMTVVGLSPALGTFLAGVVLADSEYRHELESDIEPFKGLLLGIFFISIGASLNFTLIGENILMILLVTTGLIVVKWLVLIITGYSFKLGKRNVPLFAVALAQGGEFAFVLFQLAKSEGILPLSITEPLISAVAISMFLAPLLFILYEKFSKNEEIKQDEEDDSKHMEGVSEKVILAGFGRLGIDLGRFLISAGVKPVILDNDASNVDVLRKFGFEVYYGDVTRLDLLESAGARDAKLLIITMADYEVSKKLIGLVKKHYPNLEVVVAAKDRSSVYKLMDLGVTHVKRETFGSAISLGQDALKLLGVDPYEAYRLMRIFRKNDEEMMPKLYKKYQEDREGYVSYYQNHMSNLEELMNQDSLSDSGEVDLAWTIKNPEVFTED